MTETLSNKEREPLTPQTITAELSRLLVEATTKIDSVVSPLSREYGKMVRPWLNRLAEVLGRVISSGISLEPTFAGEINAYRMQLLAAQHNESASLTDLNTARGIIGKLSGGVVQDRVAA